MRYKLKAFVGLYQCVAAVPSVFDLNTPPGLEDYTRWINLVELPSDFGFDMIVPGSCFGSYNRRLLIHSSWPIVLVLAIIACFTVRELAKSRRSNDYQQMSALRGVRGAMLSGLQRALPFVLFITFLLVPSTATQVFKAFLCDPVEYNATVTQRFLHDDLSISCDSSEYDTTVRTAVAMLIVWPLGTPLLYGVLLALSRDALREGTSTPLSLATAFLSGDYAREVYWWELVEMCRKLALSKSCRSN